MAAAGQDRRRPGGAGGCRRQSRSDPQRHLRRRPREARARRQHPRPVQGPRGRVSFLTGEPEYLDPLKDETPEGWIVTGYPWYSIKTPEHDAFLKAYQAKYNDYPRLGSIVGYQTIKAAAAILAKAGSTDPEKLIAAAEGLSMPSPFGEITFRKIDHQSTLGAFVGKTALKDGKGVMVDYRLPEGRGLSAERCRSREAAAEGVMRLQ